MRCFRCTYKWSAWEGLWGQEAAGDMGHDPQGCQRGAAREDRAGDEGSGAFLWLLSKRTGEATGVSDFRS